MLHSQSANAQFAKHFTAASGLFSENNHHVYQDNEGFVWIASDAGVHRFDGVEFEHFTSDDGLGSNEIFYIGEDTYQRVWFLSYDGTPSYFYNGTFYNPENTDFLKDAVSSQMYTHLYIDELGRVWTGSDNSEVFMIDNQDVHLLKIPSQTSCRVRAIWTEDDVVNTFCDNKLYSIDSDFNVTFVRNTDLNLQEYSRAYSGTNQYLSSSVNKVFDLRNLDKPIVTQSDLNRNVLFTSSTLLEDNILWVGTSNDGIFVIDIKNDNQILGHHLPGSFVGRVFLDNQNNIWASTLNNGVHFFPNIYSQVTQYNADNGLLSSNILSLLKLDADDILVGDDRGRLFRITDGIPEIFHEEEDVNIRHRIDRLYHIGPNSFIYTSSFHTRWYKNGETHEIKIEIADEVYALASVKSIYQVENDLFFAGSNGVHRLDMNSSTYTADIIHTGRFSSIYITGDTMYLGSNNGLWLYDMNTGDISRYEKNPKLETTIYDIVQRDDEHILFATYRYGVVQKNLNDETFSVFDRSLGLSSNLTRNIVVQDKNRIWVSTSDGLNELNFTNGLLPEVSVYRQAHGILSSNITQIVVDENALWVAGNRGLSRIPVPVISDAFRTIPLSIRAFTANNERLDIRNQPLSLPSLNRNIDVSYSGIFYSNPDVLSYRYRLSANSDWINAPPRILSFRELPFGKYTLQLQAFSDIFDLESEIQTIEFKIAPTLTESPLVRTLFAFFFFAAVGLSVVASNRYVRNKEQEKLVQLKEITELKHQALSSMMSPHFIFNALSSIRYFILNKSQKEASKYLTSFSRLIRLQLNSSFLERSTLADELERVKLYVQIEKNRLSFMLNFAVEVDEDIEPDDIKIPSLLLQPFVENAILHGFDSSTEDASISISIYPEHDKAIKVVVDDNGIGYKKALEIKKKKDGHQSLATQLIRRRLELLSLEKGVPYMIEYEDKSESGKETGTKVTLIVPA